MIKKTFTAWMLISMLAAVLFSGIAGAHGDDSEPVSHKEMTIEVKKGLNEVRKATAKYHDVDKALNDGYINTHEVAVDPKKGVMGIHFVNPALMGDNVIIPEKPEVLLYIPTKNGKYKLVGVEYYVPAIFAAEHPNLFGVPFDGPMLNHDLDPDSLTDEEKEFLENQH